MSHGAIRNREAASRANVYSGSDEAHSHGRHRRSQPLKFVSVVPEEPDANAFTLMCNRSADGRWAAGTLPLRTSGKFRPTFRSNRHNILHIK
jgi:hypothetical protein